MKIKAYGFEKAPYIFLFLAEEAKPSELPAKLRQRVGKVHCCEELELLPGQQRVGIDVNLAISDIEQRGFHISRSRVMFAGNPRGKHQRKTDVC
jgi:hypothetical protein